MDENTQTEKSVRRKVYERKQLKNAPQKPIFATRIYIIASRTLSSLKNTESKFSGLAA
jgi:hypothetical protein